MHPKSIEIRLCLPDEIAQVVYINAQWQRNALGGNLKNGFVTGNLDVNYLQEVIDKNEIVVALDGTSVVGYAMLNDIDHAPINHSKIKEMLDKGYLSPNVKIGLGTQAAVKLNYHRKGITKAMLKELAFNIRDKYDIMVSSINIQNIKSLQAHKNKAGWKVYDEDQKNIYVFYKIHENEENQEYFSSKNPLFNASNIN